MGCQCASHQNEVVSTCCGGSQESASQNSSQSSSCCSAPQQALHVPEADHVHEKGDAGCGCCGHDHGNVDAHSSLRDILLRSQSGRMMCLYALLLALSALVMQVWLVAGNWPMICALAVGLLPISRGAARAIQSGQVFSIEVLMIIAAIGAAIIGEVQEAAVVILLFQVGEILEAIAARKAQIGIQRLVDLVPQEARLLVPGGVEQVKAETLAIDDVILIGAGERIAADGVVVHGISDVDEAALTGESLPKTVMAGVNVMAGAVNGAGVLRVRVTRDAQDNAIARVARLVQEAQSRKAPVQRVINRFAQVYTPIIVSVAALVAIVPPLVIGAVWGDWFYRALALLLIGCPCALVISTPAALASALSTAARHGVLLKGGDVLEKLASVDAVAFDKTGTLTTGQPHVVQVQAVAGKGDEFVAIAAGLSLGNSHPVSRAVAEYASANTIAPAYVENVTVVPGHGVRGVYQEREVSFGALSEDDYGAVDVAAFGGAGHILSVVREGKEVIGLIVSVDTVRDHARQAVDALRSRGLQTVILTGDSQTNAQGVAQDLHMPFYARLLPADKMQHVQQWQQQGRFVLKVGDGINDAPALAAANVGLAFGGGTDVALETADGASLYNRVSDIPLALGLAKASMRNIRQNIGIALGLKAVFMVTTIAGITGLWPAILADTGATVLVTLNALRLLRYGADNTH